MIPFRDGVQWLLCGFRDNRYLVRPDLGEFRSIESQPHLIIGSTDSPPIPIQTFLTRLHLLSDAYLIDHTSILYNSFRAHEHQIDLIHDVPHGGIQYYSGGDSRLS